MKTRTDLLNHLAEKYNLQRYLEIGVQVPALNFDKIICNYRVGVDPDPTAAAAFCMTSDEFFKTGFDRLFVNTDWETKFDLIFIDGLHTAEQVKKDFENSLKILSPNGFIVLHDCTPLQEEYTIVPRPKPRGHWNGDVYKFAATLNDYNGVKHYTVDIDNGCAVITVRPDCDIYKRGEYDNYPATWEDFNENRKELLNLITWDEFISIGSHF